MVNMIDECDKENVDFTSEVEVDEEDWESIIQMQVNELSCILEKKGIQRPGQFPNGQRTSSHLVYPIVAYDAERCPYPTVLGLVLTGLAGQTLFFGMGVKGLSVGLVDYMNELLEFEGMPIGVRWNPADVFIEARVAIILLPDDILFARENGWIEMMGQVREGKRSTHRLVVTKMGRMALMDEKQDRAYKELKGEDLDEKQG
ncbi:MAG TPA: hypothetical protein EYQ78_06865 [Candidatus Poseidoniales archaeon]|nr:hypothetical protein [Candidatus Poseidoniales archaeon]